MPDKDVVDLEASPSALEQLEKNARSTFELMKNERMFVEPLWRDIADYLLPQFSGMQFEQLEDLSAGEHIFDGEAIAAHSRLADGIFGWLVSPTIPWIAFEPEDPRDMDNLKFMQYLKDIQLHLYDVFNRSNFYDMMATDIKTASGIGTSVMTVENAEELGMPIYESMHPAEIYIRENRYHKVDTLAHLYIMTPVQFLEEFGDKYSVEEKRLLSNQTKPIKMLQLVYPNKDYIDDGMVKFAQNKVYRSVHILYEGSKPSKQKTNVMKVSGMDYRRFEAWRFSRVSNQVYGTCPGIDAIYDIKMINMQSKTMADVSQLAARPPMQTTEAMKGKVRVAPGGITYGMDPVNPIVTSLNYPIGMDAMNRRAQIIREHFKTDFFMSISQLQNSSRDRTATEIMEIKAEAAAVMGSIVGRVQSERLDPIVRLTLRIERDAGRLPPLPAGIDPDKVFKLKFIGPLAQSQRKYLRVQGISQGMGSMIQLAQALGPDVLMNLRSNEAARELALANGLDPEFLNPVADVKKQQAQAAQQRAQAAQVQMENERMKAGGAAKTAEPNSMAEALMNGAPARRR